VWKEDATLPFNYGAGVAEETGFTNLPGEAC